MALRRVICNNLYLHRMEYDELELGNAYVQLKDGKLIITYPTHVGPVFKIELKKKHLYYLVVNHTTKTAFPVKKARFNNGAYRLLTPKQEKKVKRLVDVFDDHKKAPEWRPDVPGWKPKEGEVRY